MLCTMQSNAILINAIERDIKKVDNVKRKEYPLNLFGNLCQRTLARTGMYRSFFCPSVAECLSVSLSPFV